MRHLVFSSLAVAGLTVGFTAAASAADLGRPAPAPVYTKAPLAAAPFSWTGFYAGVNAGYGWGTADADYTSPGPPNGFIPVDQVATSAQGSADLKPKGFIGGAQAGYNWQVAPSWVLGVETDFQAFALKQSFDGTFTTPVAGPQITHTSIQTDWLYTLRGRAGFAIDRLLVYGTGGLAVADIKFAQSNAYPLFGAPAFNDSFSLSTTKAGWVAGAGAEYAITRNWTAKAEYLYVDLGSISGASTTRGYLNPGVPVTHSHETDLKANIVR